MEIITKAEAKAQELKRYFTGNSCKKGHFSERIVSNGACYKCAYINQKLSYSNSSDERKARGDEDPSIRLFVGGLRRGPESEVPALRISIDPASAP